MAEPMNVLFVSQSRVTLRFDFPHSHQTRIDHAKTSKRPEMDGGSTKVKQAEYSVLGLGVHSSRNVIRGQKSYIEWQSTRTR